ncbi:MAG: hypothetical protein QXT64_07725 [Desulfurococcaceae archaeon]
MLYEASRDCFNQSGRVFINDFTRMAGASRGDVIDALNKAGLSYRIVGNILIVELPIPCTLIRGEYTPYRYREKRWGSWRRWY